MTRRESWIDGAEGSSWVFTTVDDGFSYLPSMVMEGPEGKARAILLCKEDERTAGKNHTIIGVVFDGTEEGELLEYPVLVERWCLEDVYKVVGFVALGLGVTPPSVDSVSRLLTLGDLDGSGRAVSVAAATLRETFGKSPDTELPAMAEKDPE